jgi:2-octaprenyl-6-methoxyphenol hydroxylase
VAAQGFNLGLRDVAALADLIRGEADPGAADLLYAYQARRARDRERVSGVTDLMVRVFSNRIPGLAQARHWGLVAIDLAPGLRESVMRQHLGHLGLPRVS